MHSTRRAMDKGVSQVLRKKGITCVTHISLRASQVYGRLHFIKLKFLDILLTLRLKNLCHTQRNIEFCIHAFQFNLKS